MMKKNPQTVIDQHFYFIIKDTVITWEVTYLLCGEITTHWNDYYYPSLGIVVDDLAKAPQQPRNPVNILDISLKISELHTFKAATLTVLIT